MIIPIRRLYNLTLWPSGTSGAIIYLSIDLMYNFAVFVLTISRTLFMMRRGRGQGPQSAILVESLARDGAVYFAYAFHRL